MALPLKPNNPNIPIPNNPFYSDEVTYFDGPYYPAIITSTSGLAVGPDGVVNVTGGGGGGGVTALAAGPGIALSQATGSITICTNLVAGSNIAFSQSGNQISISSAGSITQVSAALPLSVTAGTTTPNITINPASTTNAGAVQLNNTLTSTSTTLALTAAQGKVLKDQIDILLVAGTIELAGTIDASTGFVASVTSVGTADGYTVGAVLPAASSTTNNTYVIVTTPGTMTPPGGAPTVATRGDWFLVSETSPGVYAWTFLNVGFDAPAASTTVPGIVELATNAETATGTDATIAVTPAGLSSAYIAKSALTAKGALISATAASTPSALSVGTDGQALVACSTATTGLCWLTLPTTLPATPTVAGVVLGCTNAFNAALGCNALLANTSGAGNIAVGFSSMCANTTGINNVAIGNVAFCSNTVGSGNVAIGTSALKNAVDSSRVVAIGEGALSAATTGLYNVALGWSALCSATGTAGGSNVAIGALAGNNITTGNSNVAIGPNVTVPLGNGNAQLAIGFNTGQCWLTGDSSRNVKFWAGIRDYTDSLGTAGQVLTSNGTVAQWANAGGAKQYLYALVGNTGVNINSVSTIPLIGIAAGGGLGVIFNSFNLTVGKTYLLTASLTNTARNNLPIIRWKTNAGQVGPEIYMEYSLIPGSSSWIYSPTPGNENVQLQLATGQLTLRREASSLTIVEI
jgi:hypothetical protein